MSDDLIQKNREAMEQAVEFTRSQDRVFHVEDTAQGSLSLQRAAPTAKRLADYSGYAFFTLGPVYTVAHVDFDIVGHMAEKLGVSFPRIALEFQHELFPSLVCRQKDGSVVSWANVLEGIPIAYLTELERFMATQHAMNRETKEFWRFTDSSVLLIDPVAVDSKALVGESGSVAIRVFLPSSNVRQMLVYPTTVVSTSAFFTFAAPDPAVEAMAAAVLGEIHD